MRASRWTWLLAGASLLASSAFASSDADAAGPTPAAATATKAVLPDRPGSVRGLADEASVNVFSGQIDYSVPIELPKGRAEFGPSLSLSYTGELGNGPLGVGWSLGLPAIKRSTRHGVPTFTAVDELELSGLGGGGRLISIGDGQYRVEGKGNAFRVIAENARFEVTDSDGTIYFFGLTAASRQEDGTRVHAWYPELVVHRSGESLAIFYSHNRGQVYLQGMAWGPMYRFEAVLEYETRTDEVVSYREGFQVITNQRLARVRVKSSGNVLRTYHLGYENEFAVSRLASVRMSGFQGLDELPTLSLPTLNLEYAPAGAAQVVSPGGLEGWQLETRGVAFFDVDGDGMDDLYRLEMGNHEYRKNLGGSFGPRTAIAGATALELAATRFIDLDGDARPELVRIVDDTWRYSRLVNGVWITGGTWPGTWNVPLEGPGVEIADVDGDGRMDVLQATTGGLQVYFGGPSGLSAPVARPPIDPSNVLIEPGGTNVEATDVNGDGLVDAVWLNDAWMKVFLGRGDGTFQAWRRTFYPWSDLAIDLRDLRLADLDRDGLVDLVRFTAGHVLMFPGNADGSFSWLSRHVARPDGGDADVTAAISDANGNGSLDIVWSSPRGMWVLDLAGPTSAGMISQIDNGLGKVVTISYGASAQLAVAAELAGVPWDRKLPVSVPVPIRVTTSPGVGPLRVVHHGVRDGFWDASERRFGGFLEARESVSGTSGADVQFEVTRFHPGEGSERVLRGKTTFAQSSTGLGATRAIEYTEWAAHPIDELVAYPLLRVPVTREVRTSQVEGVPEPIDTLRWFLHDGQGLVAEDHDLGRLDLEGDESTRIVTYATNNNTLWIRDRVCEEELRSGDGTQVSRVRTFYGELSGMVAAPCQLGVLALYRQTRGWFAEENRWVQTARVNSYSPSWNPLSVYADGVTRAFQYDSDDFHLIRETVTPVTGQPLRWYLSWDAVRELPLTVTDASGAVTTLAYDVLGRLATVAQANAPPHIRYEYDWTSPQPTTTTYVFDGPEANLDQWSGGYVQGAGWRQTVEVANGAGETLFTGTRLETNRWIVNEWTERDERGRTARVFDSFYHDAADIRTASPPTGTPSEELSYDAFDRLRQHRRPTGTERQVDYWAFGRRVTDDDLAPVTSLFDGKGRVVRTERTIGPLLEVGKATYDAADRMLTLRLQPDPSSEVLHEFVYDGLGRLVRANDPDIGERHLLHNDDGFLIEQTNAAGQTIQYSYDGAGRVTSVLADDGSSFTYHYDVPLDSAYQFTAGRLAWVEELTGTMQLGYDARGRQVKWQRSIVDSVASVTLGAEEEHTFAPSGLLRSVDFKDGLAIAMTYDDAGRATEVGDLWTAGSHDAAGRVLSESYGNGVTQAYGYDLNGDLEDVEVRRPMAAGGALLYQAAVTRNGFGAISSVTDSDGVGLNHAATFTYDTAGRLTDATVGPSSAEYQFRYRYDGLQNMIERGASGPTGLGALVGEYRYGGPRAGGGTHGPRQLTSIEPIGGGTPTSTFAYDLAGRQTQQNGLTLTYNGLDQLTQISGLGSGSGSVQHAYGYDGFRVLTRSTAGATQYWFTPGISHRNGLREHYIRLGDRLIARVDQRELPPGGGGGFVTVYHDPRPARALLLALLAVSLLLLGYSFTTAPGRTPRRRFAHASGLLVALGLIHSGCGLFGSDKSPLWENAGIIYFHQGISPGPTLLTREDGTVLEERRYEPFGDELDAFREPAGGGAGQTGAIDYTVDAHNILNKQSDPDTGWSYHGARWMAPDTARWLTPDPPVKAPDPKFIAEPWASHPYQYVSQNPIAFWDPDGRQQQFIPLPGNGEAILKNQYETVFVPKAKDALMTYGVTAGSVVLGHALPRVAFLLIMGQASNENEVLPAATLAALTRVRVPIRAGAGAIRTGSRSNFWATWQKGLTNGELATIRGGSAAASGGSGGVIRAVRDDAYTINRHTSAGIKVARDLARGREAHIFADGIDLAALEAEVWAAGAFKGNVRGWDRFTFTSATPIGTRIQNGRPSVPLHTVEIKGRLESGNVWKYHLVPRTRAAR
jgi:RHS repeat-associated protein